MSTPIDSLRRITAGGLSGDVSAVFVASKFDENTIITDVYAMVDGQFTNVSLSNESGTSIGTVRNYYVYGDDIDDDGLIELPELVSNQGKSQNLIRWYNLTPSGGEQEKIFTYHNYVDDWYVQLEQRWILSLLVQRTESEESVFEFSILQRGNREFCFPFLWFEVRNFLVGTEPMPGRTGCSAAVGGYGLPGPPGTGSRIGKLHLETTGGKLSFHPGELENR